MARPATISADDIHRAASELLDELGVDALTMRRVGDRLGVSGMALYRHVEGRDGLLALVADRGFDDLASRFGAAAASSADPVAGLLALLDVFVDLALSRPHLFRLMFTDERPGARDLTREAADSPTLVIVVDLLDQAVSGGLLGSAGSGTDMAEQPLTELAVGGAALVQGLCLSRITGRLQGGTDAEFRGLVERCVRHYLA